MTLTFGQTLRDQRLKLGKDLKKMSAETGVSISQRGRIERGRANKLRPESIRRLAPAYGISCEALMLLAGYGHMPHLMNNLPLFISEAARTLSPEDWEPLRSAVAQLVAEKTIALNQ
ncbi:helix-turn-helix transcriptional regulator [Deinococcus radiomollis]|uniref:helix-turn-helix domain-containing protein n=1 Tax=Deinococcus radiomollis TaxID=468916 RepID=UPI003892591D